MFQRYLCMLLMGMVLVQCSSKTPGSNASSSNENTQQPILNTSGDNAMNALDWDGVYRGTLPCSDCDGIHKTVYLQKDLTYKITTRYLGKTDSLYEERGSFQWNEAGNTITLEGNNHITRFFVGENTLTQLDENGNRINGDLAERYMLTKGAVSLMERYWKLTELNGTPVLWDSGFKREPHIIFKAESPVYNGHGGCNSVRGKYEIYGNNKINIGQGAATLMACKNQQTEQAFFKVLNETASFFVNADNLTLYDSNGQTLALFKSVYMQ